MDYRFDISRPSLVGNMLARLQRLIVFVLVATVAAWSGYVVWLGHPVWIACGIGTIVTGYLAVLGLEFWLLGRSYPDGDDARPSAAQLLLSWRDEVLIAPRVFLWQQPFRSNAIPDSLARESRGRRGVVLVHGFVCNRGLWNPWMRRLRTGKIPFVAVTLEPVFGSMDRYVDSIDAAVRRVEAVTGLAPLVVAHSMGGLAVRAWLARRGGPDRFLRIVTIATPHRGTWLARFGRAANGLEMRMDSPWLRALSAMESPGLRARFTCYWGHCDNIVFPTAGAMLDGADNRHLPATPHVAMAFHPAPFDEVLRLVEAK